MKIKKDQTHELQVFPVVIDIEEGYRRGGFIKSDEGEYGVIIGVSNTKVDEPVMNYERQKDEEINYVLGMIIHSSKEATLLSDFLKDVANTIKQEGR